MRYEFIAISSIDEIKKAVNYYKAKNFDLKNGLDDESYFPRIKAIVVDNKLKTLSTTNGTCMARFKDCGGTYTKIFNKNNKH